MKKEIKNKNLKFPELSYQIVGVAFEVYNELGFGHREKTYQKAMSILFDSKKINYKRENYFPVKFRGQVIGKNFFDFLVEDKIIVELKKNMKFSKAHGQGFGLFRRIWERACYFTQFWKRRSAFHQNYK